MEKTPSIHIISAGKYPKDLRKYIAFQAKKHRLFSPMGGLSYVYTDILNGIDDSNIIAMASINGDPVGIIYYTGLNIWIFVKKRYRRQGVGTKLIKYMQTKRSIKVRGHRGGTQIGTKFFDKLGLL